MTSTLAVFPLGSPLLPHQVLPLHVFEERYRVLMRHCLEGDRRFGVVLIERGREVASPDGMRDDVPFTLGTVGELVEAIELPDGRWAIQVVGTRRFRVEEWLPDDPYPRAEVVELDEERGNATADDVSRLLEGITARLDRIGAMRAELGEPVPRSALDHDPIVASWQAAMHAGFGPLDLYRVLEAETLADRLALLVTLLDDAEAVLRFRA